MPYDPNAPAANLELQASDDILRADKTFLKNGLEREHYFDGTETAGSSGDHLLHRTGSARVFIFTGATPLNAGTLASGYSLAKARSTGMVVLDKPVGRAWFCWDGAADGWIELSKLGGALEVVGALTVGGGLTVGSTLAAGGDINLATSRKLNVPAETWLREGAVDIRPHAHGARHKLGGGNGTWVSALDAVRGLIQDIASATHSSGAAMTGSYVNRVQITRDFRTRAGATTKAILLGIHNCDWDSGEIRFSARITRDTGTVGTVGAVAADGVPNFSGLQTSTVVFEVFENLTSAIHTFEIQSKVDAGGASYVSSYLLLLDLGDAT